MNNGKEHYKFHDKKNNKKTQRYKENSTTDI